MPVLSLAQLDGDDAGRDGDDGVAHDHHHRGQGLTQWSLWGDVAIADCREGNDGPVDAPRNAVDAVFRNADGGVFWEALSDEFFEPYEDSLSTMTQRLFSLSDEA